VADAFFFPFKIIRDSLDNSDIMTYMRLERMRYAILCVDTDLATEENYHYFHVFEITELLSVFPF